MARGVRRRRAGRVSRVAWARTVARDEPGSPEAAARAGSMRAAGGGGVQPEAGRLRRAPLAPRRPRLRPEPAEAAAPPPGAPTVVAMPATAAEHFNSLHPILIYDTLYLIRLFFVLAYIYN